MYNLTLGAIYTSTHTHFRVWAPAAKQMEVHLLRDDRLIPMEVAKNGYFLCTIEGIQPGERYFYRIDGDKERPDPASKSQAEGVHGPSSVVDTSFEWTDTGWQAPHLRNSIFYELHVGTFTPEGTFDAIIPHLPYLKSLGITSLQLMPIAQFPGKRNWGYDGVQLYAPHTAYGGVKGLQGLVNACHEQGLAVFLDAVYNHLGPEGNYLWDYAPDYFTDRYHSPWGDSLNFDGAHSDEVRRFFIENAIYWLKDYHIDGLRLDATHALLDFSAQPFLQELGTAVHEWSAHHNRHVTLVAENDRSDRRLTLSTEANGVGMDAQWLDDLHHVLHVSLTGESDGYYADYQDFALVPKVLSEGFAYSGQYSPARQRRHGTSGRDIPSDRFIVATQTHDQIGNRMLGERLSQLTDFAGLKLAACLLATSPYVPMLFMGEEYAETSPFLYFVSHGDEHLIEAVQQGRAEEFAAFKWKGTPPDPQAESTFQDSKVQHQRRELEAPALMLRIYQELLALRKAQPALTNPRRTDTIIYADLDKKILCMERHSGDNALRIVMNFDLERYQSIHLHDNSKTWRKIYDANAPEWCHSTESLSITAPEHLAAGSVHDISLAPKAFAIYERQFK